MAKTRRPIDRKAVEELAQAAVAVLRSEEFKLTDPEILHYLQPNAADHRFERRQRRGRGYVFAPPALIKARMWALLCATAVVNSPDDLPTVH